MTADRPSSADHTAVMVPPRSIFAVLVSASGAEKDYPGLSSCIAGQMQGWKFPPSSGSLLVRPTLSKRSSTTKVL